MAKEEKTAKKTEKKAEKPEMIGTKDLAKILKVDPKRLRTVLRAAGKGVSGDGEVGRYQWKPGDDAAISKVRKLVDDYEAKAADRKAKKDAEDKKTAKKGAAKKSAKKSKKEAPADDESEEVFEEGDEEAEE
jgi:hypothetical protein